MQKNGSYLSPLYLLSSNTYFSLTFKEEKYPINEKNFTEKAMWAYLVIAPANQVCFDFCLLKGGIIFVQKGKLREDRILTSASDTKNIFIYSVRYT